MALSIPVGTGCLMGSVPITEAPGCLLVKETQAALQALFRQGWPDSSNFNFRENLCTCVG